MTDLLNNNKINFISEVQSRLLSPVSDEFKAELIKLFALYPAQFTYMLGERKRVYHPNTFDHEI